MRQSQRYRDLTRRLYELRRCFLPEEFDPFGNYDRDTLMMASAYIVLAHAEIESFIEDRATETAIAAMKSWRDHKKVDCILIGLIGHYAKQIKNNDPDDTNQKINRKKDINDMITQSTNIFLNEIKANNGIRESSISKLLTPIGIGVESFDPTWILNMDNYGRGRGEIAHISQKNYTTKKQINPEEEFKMVNSLVRNGLKKLDFITEGLIKNAFVDDFVFILNYFQSSEPENEISEAMSNLFPSLD
jgi:hypothetical protein